MHGLILKSVMLVSTATELKGPLELRDKEVTRQLGYQMLSHNANIP